MIEQLSLWIVTIIFGIMLFFVYWYISIPVVVLVIIIWHGIVSGFSKLAGMIAAALAGIIAIMLYVTLSCWASTGVPQPCM